MYELSKNYSLTYEVLDQFSKVIKNASADEISEVDKELTLEAASFGSTTPQTVDNVFNSIIDKASSIIVLAKKWT